MITSKPTIAQREDKGYYRTEVFSSSREKDLWYSVNKKFGDMVSDSADDSPLLLLFPAMFRGEDNEIKAVVSEELYYHLAKYVQVLLQSVYPRLYKMQINLRELCTSHQQAQCLATGFSGGIDSYCVLAGHYYSDDVPDDFRFIHLLFNNVGSQGAERLSFKYLEN